MSNLIFKNKSTGSNQRSLQFNTPGSCQQQMTEEACGNMTSIQGQSVLTALWECSATQGSRTS